MNRSTKTLWKYVRGKVLFLHSKQKFCLLVCALALTSPLRLMVHRDRIICEMLRNDRFLRKLTSHTSYFFASAFRVNFIYIYE